MNKKVYAIILAGGTGKRIDPDSPKQFLEINKKSILEYSITAFEKNGLIDEIILVFNKKFVTVADRITSEKNYTKLKNIIEGGATRQQSSFNGLSAIQDDDSIVLIHDAARPFVSQEIITDCIKMLGTVDAVAPVLEISDTIAKVDSENKVVDIPDRQLLKRIQTPQGFKTSIIKHAHELYMKDGNNDATDDCSMVLFHKLADVHTIHGSEINIKITYPEDVKLAEKLFLNHKEY